MLFVSTSKEFHPLISHYLATIMLFVSTSSSDYFVVTCCHTCRPQPIEHVREIIATDHTL